MRLFNRLLTVLVVALSAAATSALASGPGSFDLLEGDKKLACEALLCLSSGARPSQCDPALSHFYGIKKKKLSDTLDARHDFLKLCPSSNQTKEMASLADALARGAGRCDAGSLNAGLGAWRGTSDDGFPIISNKRPGYCNAYASHEYTSFEDDLPRYVGTPEERGYWVEAKDYERELAKYEKELAERKAREPNSQGTGYGMVGN
ncbi:TrbM [compost metagenome]